MKINKLEKSFEKLIKKEFDSDGFARIDKVVINRQTDEISLTVVVGHCNLETPDGNWSKDVTLVYPDGKGVEFIKGMIYEYLRRLF